MRRFAVTVFALLLISAGWLHSQVNNTGRQYTATAPISISGNNISCSSCGGAGSISEWFVPPNIINTTVGSPVSLTGANAINWTEIFIPFNLTVTHLTYFVQTLDNSANRYDVCIYNSSGTLQANIGATQFATAVQRDDAIAQSSVTLSPGVYYVGWTGNATVAKLYTQVPNSNFVALQLHANPATTSSGGVCPASATVPALSATNVTVSWLWLGMH